MTNDNNKDRSFFCARGGMQTIFQHCPCLRPKPVEKKPAYSKDCGNDFDPAERLAACEILQFCCVLRSGTAFQALLLEAMQVLCLTRGAAMNDKTMLSAIVGTQEGWNIQHACLA